MVPCIEPKSRRYEMVETWWEKMVGKKWWGKNWRKLDGKKKEKFWDLGSKWGFELAVAVAVKELCGVSTRNTGSHKRVSKRGLRPKGCSF